MKEVFLKAKKVNMMALILILPISFLITMPFLVKWSSHIRGSLKMIKALLSVFDNKLLDTIIIIFAPTVLIFIGIVIHELIHGFFMAIFSKDGIKSVKFGIMKQSFVFYAHCKEPLLAKNMLIVSLAPFVFLGLIPTIYSFISGSLIIWFIGFSMTIGAIGDFIYAYLILKTGLGKMILDHDCEVGFKIVD